MFLLFAVVCDVCVRVCVCSKDVLLEPDVFYLVKAVFSIVLNVRSKYPSLMILLFRNGRMNNIQET